MSVNKVLFDARIKPKNVLALNEKVAAIRRYEVDPVYKKVGRMFNCSPDQIKRIIKNKDEILAEWENRTKKSSPPTSRTIKTVKISFLGKAVHEWIRRIMYYTDFNLNDTLIQTMSLEFAKVLKMPKFYPTKEWITNFRATYNLPDANTKTMNIGYQESHSVQIRDILQYVRDAYETQNVALEDDQPSASSVESAVIMTDTNPHEAVEEIKTEGLNGGFCDIVMKEEEETYQPSCSAVIRACDFAKESNIPSSTRVSPQKSMQINSVTVNSSPTQIQFSKSNIDQEEILPTEVENVKVKLEPDLEIQLSDEREENPASAVESRPEEAISEPDVSPDDFVIYSHEGAISCVKLLEEFALLKENFRLIGLIERLEEALNEKADI